MLYGLIILFTLLDLVTKWSAASMIKPDASVSIIPGWLSWRVIHNDGASFGMFTGHESLIVAVSIVVIVFIFYLHAKSRNKGFITRPVSP